MMHGQGKWTLRWTEHWLSSWAPRVVSPVAWTPQGVDGGFNTLISDLGDGRGHIPTKSAQETKWGAAVSVLQLYEPQQARQRDREQRREDLGIFYQCIQISDEGGRKENREQGQIQIHIH